ncbi:hypothetical protein cu1905 [Corynebacterium urealyticum DSM 7109]|uniref:Uncharacterized protein n=2 Tax=Corynebacterium urealyticum TaxID=43771 RepID=B1VIR8_CORU7|nr:hypothetical protein cu1905 [Corynebacterium urealyticum DSM 7109]
MLSMKDVDLQGLVGARLESGYLKIDQRHLSEFSHSTFLDEKYVDLTISRNNALGPELVDGFLLLSLLTYFSFDQPFIEVEGAYGFNYGLDSVRFTAPVMVDEEVRVVREIKSAVLKTDTRARVVESVTMYRRGSTQPVMVADWVMMYVDRLAEERGRA